MGDLHNLHLPLTFRRSSSVRGGHYKQAQGFLNFNSCHHCAFFKPLKVHRSLEQDHNPEKILRKSLESQVSGVSRTPVWRLLGVPEVRPGLASGF